MGGEGNGEDNGKVTAKATTARTMLALLRESDRVLLREAWLRVGLVVVVVGVGD